MSLNIAHVRKPRMLPPVNTYQAVCQNVWDLGFQVTNFNGEEKIVPKVVIAWELNETIPSGDFAGKRFVLSNTYTKSLHEKSNLYACLRSWRGRDFTPEELKSFDLEQMIGQNCLLSVIHEQGSDGNTYPKIGAVMMLPANLMAPITSELGRTTPKWVTDRIAKQVPADEAVGGHGGGSEVPFGGSEANF